MLPHTLRIIPLALVLITQRAAAQGLIPTVQAITKLTETIAKGGLIALGLVLVLVVVPLGHKVRQPKWLLTLIIGLGVGCMVAGVWFVPRQLILSGKIREDDDPHARNQLLIRSNLVANSAQTVDAFLRRQDIRELGTDFALISMDYATCLLVETYREEFLSKNEQQVNFFKVPITPDDYGEGKQLLLYLSQDSGHPKLYIERITRERRLSSVAAIELPAETLNCE